MKLFWRICHNGGATRWRYSADCAQETLDWMVWVRFCHDPDLLLNLKNCGDARLEFGVGPSEDQADAIGAEEMRRIFAGDKNAAKRKALLAAMGAGS